MPTGGAVEVDYDSIINDIVSLYDVPAPSHGSLLDMSDMVYTPTSVSSSPPQKRIKLDREVCQILSQDIEKMKSNNAQIDSIMKQFLVFAGSSKSSEVGGGTDTAATSSKSSSSSQIIGDTAKLAVTTPVLNTLTKLEWMVHICHENSVALDSLSTVLENKQHIWNMFPVAIYDSLDCMIQLCILWKLFGAYVNVQALGSGRTDDTLLDHENPQVVHAKQEINSMLEIRKKIRDPDVPITEILLDVIIPVIKTIHERLR
uniref:Wsv023-like protein n=1 Tax=Sesarmops intermedium nimavirus TaxID=2133796 RepID=A0A401IPS4_9VIRU|nr:MAG: wsv023-like protein [Sesarmops intermedium nimavirus]GBG35612.1 wsv023-like protein [Sesarmops intermedium nimavirus]